MRQIIRWREIVEDELRYAAELEPEESAASGTILVRPLATHLELAGAAAHVQQPDALPLRPVAVQLGPADAVEALAPHLANVRWIVIDFPKVGEGRGYSQARLLRQRYGYRYELRARGAIKRDQLFFLARCGFDAFELDPAEDPQVALEAFGSFTVAYQAGSEALIAPDRRPAALA